jgi:hypothetical protein
MQATAANKDWRPILSQMIRFILKVNRELDDNLG